MQLFFSLNCQI